ncbi:TRAP transporter large permease subunit [Terrarubrum flagellatum]|uniref:TRAP transporter large permease subunit n=1 Tax=Terrirubrum flagellatum TaxID=2895980 RepID=UPI0031451254
MSGWFGLALFPLVGIAMILTGLPAFLVLIGAAGLAAAWIVLAGDGALLGALPNRMVGLLESDLLQALPLFVMMGALINRLPLADILFRAGCRLFRRPTLAALGLGALLAPMNGSVGASVAVLSRSVRPMLAQAGVEPVERTALVAAASTLGVVIPPSLVLILLGDAMMGAHTIASNIAGRSDQIINTQDIFRAALAPAALTLALWAGIVAWRGRGPKTDASQSSASRSDLMIAAATAAFILILLGGVASGLFYAVEAAAMGCIALLAAGWVTRALTAAALADALRSTLEISGALFALLIAATTFTLTLRILGTDRLLTGLIGALPGGPTIAVASVLALVGVSALALDAFEIIFVIVPILMPGLLVRAADAAWVSALTILTLQASFLVPPVGYAIMMARGAELEPVRARPLAGALAPFLIAQLLVVMLALAIPPVTHFFDRAPPPSAPKNRLSDDEVSKKFDALAPEPPPALDLK